MVLMLLLAPLGGCHERWEPASASPLAAGGRHEPLEERDEVSRQLSDARPQMAGGIHYNLHSGTERNGTSLTWAVKSAMRRPEGHNEAPR